jgi:hypothetical protein
MTGKARSCLGGTVEDGEDPAVAAVRISREDCGVLIEVTAVVADLSGDQYRILYECDQDTTYRATVYDVRIVAGPVPDALTMTGWFAPDEFQDLKFNEFASVALADLGLT